MRSWWFLAVVACGGSSGSQDVPDARGPDAVTGDDAAPDGAAVTKVRIDTRTARPWAETSAVPTAVRVKAGAGGWVDATLVAPGVYEAPVTADYGVAVVCHDNGLFMWQLASESTTVALPCGDRSATLITLATTVSPVGPPHYLELPPYVVVSSEQPGGLMVPAGTYDAAWFDEGAIYLRRDLQLTTNTGIDVDLDTMGTARPAIAATVHGLVQGNQVRGFSTIATAHGPFTLISYDSTPAGGAVATITVQGIPGSLLAPGESARDGISTDDMASTDGRAYARTATWPAGASTMDVTLMDGEIGFVTSTAGADPIASWTTTPAAAQTVTFGAFGPSSFEEATYSRGWLDLHDAQSIRLEAAFPGIAADKRIDGTSLLGSTFAMTWSVAGVDYDLSYARAGASLASHAGGQASLAAQLRARYP